ncbi:uncharacterized protein PV09_01068 [Verruconis gallopava]|uniref:Uncharacterized protein n=1 Tax=Verruconis gallopava TaxID=253628 RepID=A0A0D2BA33_9PEZI|nr:uncharacterized protein PV09_01068 [Verruconis gallopava]KIW08134.1 hypothetical protein PV09_01068 [Verruconis gallopava]
MADFTNYDERVTSPMTEVMEFQPTISHQFATSSGWDNMPPNIRAMIYKNVLPPLNGGEAISLSEFKAYYKDHCALLQVDHRTFVEAREWLFSANNFSVYYSPDHPEGLKAISIFGLGAFTTITLDIQVTDFSRIYSLFNILSQTTRLRHLSIRAYVDSYEFPDMGQREKEVKEFIAQHGDRVTQNMIKIKDIEIDLVGIASVAGFDLIVSRFIQHAWMKMIFKFDLPLAALTKHALFMGRPTIKLSAIQDRSIYARSHMLKLLLVLLTMLHVV